MAGLTSSGFAGMTDRDVIIRIATQLDDKGIKQAVQRIKELDRQTEQATKQARRFQFGWLGVMFFAMQLQRQLGGVLKSGISTFENITNATYGTVTAMDGLNAATTFLAFSIGDALNSVIEPYLPIILDFIEGIADFIQQHPEVVMGMLAAFIGAIAIQEFSQVKLLINSIKSLGKGDVDAWDQVSGKISGIAKIAAAGIAISLALEGMKDIQKDFLKGIGEMAEAAGFSLMLFGKGKAGALVYTMGIAAVVADAAMKQGMAGFVNALESSLANAGIFFVASGQYWTLPILASILFGAEFWKAWDALHSAVQKATPQQQLGLASLVAGAMAGNQQQMNQGIAGLTVPTIGQQTTIQGGVTINLNTTSTDNATDITSILLARLANINSTKPIGP